MSYQLRPCRRLPPATHATTTLIVSPFQLHQSHQRQRHRQRLCHIITSHHNVTPLLTLPDHLLTNHYIHDGRLYALQPCLPHPNYQHSSPSPRPFKTLLDSQAPISSTHSAYSELLSVSHSAFPPSTLPISTLTDLVSSSTTPSTSLSSKSSFSSVSTLVDGMTGVGATTAGLDLLGILAEEVDWDPQHKGTPGAAQLALLGQSLQSHHEAKQRVWASSILDSLGLGSRRGSFATLNASESPKGQRMQDDGLGKHKSRSAIQARKSSLTEDPLNTMTLTKRTALFYENLYEHLCPGIVPRAYIYPKLGRKSHDQDPSFAALALSISLLGLLGVTLPKTSASTKRKAESAIDTQHQQPFVMPYVPPERRSKAHDSGSLRIQALHLIERILQLRLAASGGGVSFGQAPTLEVVLTGFFLSIALYNLDDATHEGGMPTFTEWKDASFFRFCETITLAKILGLDQIGAAATEGGGDGPEEVMVWSMLVRAERWWAEQRLGYVCQMETGASSLTRDGGCGRKRVKTHEDDFNTMPSKRPRTLTSSHAVQPMQFLVQLGFSSVRDTLLYRFHDVVECWSHACSSCSRLTPESALHIHDSLASLDLSPSSSSSSFNAPADPILIDLARQALRAKLWIACLNHNLVSVHAQAPLRPDQPLHIALDTLDLLEDLDLLVLRPLPADAALGQAIHEALQAIRDCVSRLPQGQFAAEMFSFEQVEAGDECESLTGASPQRAQEEEEQGAAKSHSTTITRAAQSVMDNLDRFLDRLAHH